MIKFLTTLGRLIPFYESIATVVIVFSCLITIFFPTFWSIIPALTTYGKTADQLETHRFLQFISVPKSWFTHFYAIGTATILSSGYLLYLVIEEQFLVPEEWRFYLNLLTKPYQTPPIDLTTGCLAIFLIGIHVSRRLYESLFVSVYSDCRMNLFHYAVGIIHYIVLPLSIISETKGIASKLENPRINIEKIQISQWISAVTFVYCNLQQHSFAEKIANTRKLPSGLIRNYAYGICFGGWFNYVSCPHFLFEIFIYLSLWFIIPSAYAFRFVLFFVLCNQFLAAQITHRWYQKTFPKYPPKRTALIPYLY